MIPGSANALLLRSAAATGYTISRSLRFNAADSAFLSRTPASAGNRKTWTWAGWVKRSALGSAQMLFSVQESNTDTGRLLIYFGSDDKLTVDGATINFRRSTQIFRDPSAWYHIQVSTNTTLSAANDRFKLFVNGTLVSAFDNITNPSQNADTGVNTATEHNIGRQVAASAYLSALLGEMHLVDGQALDPTSFGEFSTTTGVWMPKAYTGSYGTNGFRLDFADNSSAAALGYDAAGSNDWTVNNLSVTAGAGNDSLVDVPTNGSEADTGSGGQVRGNYATLNPLNKGSQATLLNGNLEFSHVGNTVSCRVVSTIAMSSGKWYCEYTPTTTTQLDNVGIALATESAGVNYLGGTAGSYSYYAVNGQKYTNGSQAAYGATYTNGDVIGIAFDADAGTLTFYKNGTSQGTAFTGIAAGSYVFGQGNYTGTTYTGVFNFGQRAFAYPVSGFKALNTSSLPAPVITKPSTVMDVKLYTGNGSTQTISGLNMSPDLVWIKSRSTTYNHYLVDQIRGTGVFLQSNSTGAEGSASNVVTSLGSESFSLGNSLAINDATATYAAWCWDAGSSTVTNTAGSISSQVRTNNYLSVVTYTGNGTAGATVGHGLGVAPSMLIIKRRNSTSDWAVYHGGLATPTTKWLSLNLTNAQRDATYPNTVWNSTAPTSTLFTVGDDAVVNASGATYVAYCFAPVAGYSAFGSYTGNGSTDGPFVFCNFRPRYLLIKDSSQSASWNVIDTASNPFNVCTAYLTPNLSDVEGNYAGWDILSNGFKLRNTGNTLNTSGNRYIYAAFAESPFQYARAR